MSKLEDRLRIGISCKIIFWHIWNRSQQNLITSANKYFLDNISYVGMLIKSNWKLCEYTVVIVFCIGMAA